MVVPAPAFAAVFLTVRHRFPSLSTSIASALPCYAGIIRSELYKIRDTQTPYGVNVQTIVDVSVILRSYARCCIQCAMKLCTLLHCVLGRPAAAHTCSVESVGVTAACCLLQNIAKLRATASMAADDQGIVLNGTANIVSPSSRELGCRFVPPDH